MIMADAMLTPVEITNQWRGTTLAAASHDGTWTYHRTRGRWAVTHAATGRRYWTATLDQGREQTADGTAADFLDIGHPLPNGKPITPGEHLAVMLELSTADMRDMLDHLAVAAPEAVAIATARIKPASPPAALPSGPLTQMLGVVYGQDTGVWLAALRAIRTDLIPPHVTAQAA